MPHRVNAVLTTAPNPEAQRFLRSTCAAPHSFGKGRGGLDVHATEHRDHQDRSIMITRGQTAFKLFGLAQLCRSIFSRKRVFVRYRRRSSAFTASATAAARLPHTLIPQPKLIRIWLRTSSKMPTMLPVLAFTSILDLTCANSRERRSTTHLAAVERWTE